MDHLLTFQHNQKWYTMLPHSKACMPLMPGVHPLKMMPMMSTDQQPDDALDAPTVPTSIITASDTDAADELEHREGTPMLPECNYT